MPVEENTIDALRNEAFGYGIASMVILNQDDPLSRKEAVNSNHRGACDALAGNNGPPLRALRKKTS